MSLAALLDVLRSRVTDAVRTWAPGARGAWCRTQRRRLRSSAGSVVWVRGAAAPWAEWGARHGYFEVQYMDGLPYLRPVTAPAV